MKKLLLAVFFFAACGSGESQLDQCLRELNDVGTARNVCDQSLSLCNSNFSRACKLLCANETDTGSCFSACMNGKVYP